MIFFFETCDFKSRDYMKSGSPVLNNHKACGRGEYPVELINVINTDCLATTEDCG